MRLIDADKLKKHKYHDSNRYENAVAVYWIDNAPTIEAEPVKHGHWISECSCSNCNWIHEDLKGHALLTNYNYCPACGAKMDWSDKE